MDNPIINLEKLSKPITKLVDVVSKGIGTLYAPFGTVRQAEADAKAKIIHAKADTNVLDIHERAQHRLIYREALRQENIERIASQAALELPNSVSEEPLDDDWVMQFFGCAEDVCDVDMQMLWSRILAGEVTTPGQYSKRTLQFLKTLDKWEAENFSKLCSFAFTTEQNWHFIIDDGFTYTKLNEILGDGNWVGHFSSIGLLSSETSMHGASDLSGMKLNYFLDKYIIDGPEKPSTTSIASLEIPLSIRNFTSVGQELARIAEAAPMDEYIVGLCESLNDKDINVSFNKVKPDVDS